MIYTKKKNSKKIKYHLKPGELNCRYVFACVDNFFTLKKNSRKIKYHLKPGELNRLYVFPCVDNFFSPTHCV